MMKHIQLFEDYSEEELRDLQDDLHDIGHKSRFVQGEDFGLGYNFKKTDWLYDYPTISKEMFDLLLKRGEIIINSVGDSYFKNPEKFGIVVDNIYKNPKLQDLYNGKGTRSIEYQGRVGDDDSVVYDRIMKKLGEIRR
jgi:hypothetical protein